MKKLLLSIASIFFVSLSSIAQDTLSEKEKVAAYNQTINTRSERIVTALAITDTTKFSLVKNIIADQYKNLNNVYSSRDLKIKTEKVRLTGETKEVQNAAISKIKEAAVAEATKLHADFITQLSGNLTAAQLDQVKNGMTYNVLNVTYNGYNQMIRTLTTAQQQQIMTWLIEARELAMDAESSEKKAWCIWQIQRPH